MDFRKTKKWTSLPTEKLVAIAMSVYSLVSCQPSSVGTRFAKVKLVAGCPCTSQLKRVISQLWNTWRPSGQSLGQNGHKTGIETGGVSYSPIITNPSIFVHHIFLTTGLKIGCSDLHLEISCHFFLYFSHRLLISFSRRPWRPAAGATIRPFTARRGKVIWSWCSSCCRRCRCFTRWDQMTRDKQTKERALSLVNVIFIDL